MKKIQIQGKIEGADSETVGSQLEVLLRLLPSQNADEAVKKVLIAKELKLALDAKAEWFSFEDADESVLSELVDKAAQSTVASTIAAIKMALKDAVAFKGEEPTETTK